MRNSNDNSALAGWKRTLLLLCALVVAAIFPLSLGAISAEYTLFRPAPYLKAADELGLYRNYPGLMLDFATAGGDIFAPGLGNLLLRYLQQRGAEQALAFLFPEEWVRDQVETLADRFWSYYNLEAPELDISLDFTPVKTSLSGEEAMTIIRGGIADWPACSAEDVVRILALLLQGKTQDLPQCLPPESVKEAFLGAIQTGLKSFAQTLPDRVQILPYQSTPPAGPYRDFRLGLRLAPVILLILCLLAAGLQNFSPRLFWAWCALPFYAGGLVNALTAVLMISLARWILFIPVRLLPAAAGELYSFFSLVFLQVGESWLIWMAAAGVLAATVGLVLFLLHLDRDA
jgi:hypothetical protein